jgi:hypothetical protein
MVRVACAPSLALSLACVARLTGGRLSQTSRWLRRHHPADEYPHHGNGTSSGGCYFLRMANLFLAPTTRYFGIGDSNDYVVLDGGRVIGRIMLHRKDQMESHDSGRSRRWSIRPLFTTKVIHRHANKRWQISRRDGWRSAFSFG